MVNFGPLAAEIGLVLGASQQISTAFACWLRYCTDVAQWTSTKVCMMFCCLLGWYTFIYTHFWGFLPRNGILLRAKFTLRPSLAFCYIGGVTARHSSSGRQPNAAFSRGRHLYPAGWPSRWASAHIVSVLALRFQLVFAL